MRQDKPKKIVDLISLCVGLVGTMTGYFALHFHGCMFEPSQPHEKSFRTQNQYNYLRRYMYYSDKRINSRIAKGQQYK